MKSGGQQKNDELLMSSPSNASTSPRAVMVVHLDATVTFPAVETPRRTDNVASLANLQFYQISSCFKRLDVIFVTRVNFMGRFWDDARL